MPIVFVLLWSTGFVAAKYGLSYAEPLTFLFIRLLIASVLVAAIAAVTGARWPKTGAEFGHHVVAGILVHACYLSGVYIAIAHRMPAGIAALVVGLQPVLTSTLANRLLGERVIARQWAGLLLGLVGVYFVVQGRTTGGTTDVVSWVAITVALAGITLGTVYQKRFGAGADVWGGLPIQYGATAVVTGIGALMLETRAVHWTAPLIGSLAWLIIVLSCAAVWLLYVLIRRSAASRVASLFYLVPPVTALLSWVLFGEVLEWLSLVGMALCVIGVLLVTL